MKRGDLYGLHQNLGEASRTAKGIKLSYAIVKSIRHIEKEIQILEELKKPSEDYQAYEKERVALCLAHSRKDEKTNQPKIVGREYDIIDRPAFEKAIEELRTRHKAAVDETELRQSQYNKFLEEEFTPRLHKIKFLDILAEQEELKKKGADVKDLLDADKLNKIWDIVIDDVDADEAPTAAQDGKAEDKAPDLKMVN